MTVIATVADLLQDIATHIHIEPDFSLRHDTFPEWDVPEIVTARLQASTREIQAKFICTQLQTYLHCIYFSRSILPLTYVASSDTSAASLSNSNVRGLNTAFYAQIEQANTGQGYFDPDWIRQKIQIEGLVAVQKEGLCLQVQPEEIHPDYRTAKVGEKVAIQLPKNLLTVDRYIAIGNRGRVPLGSQTLAYFNCPSQTALTLMSQIVRDFNQLALPFELQILLHPEEYPRPDALILQWASLDDAVALASLADTIATHQSALADPTPAFTQSLAPGVGTARVTNGQMFPQFIWRSIAQSLATTWLEKITDTTVKTQRIEQGLTTINTGNLFTSFR